MKARETSGFQMSGHLFTDGMDRSMQILPTCNVKTAWLLNKNRQKQANLNTCKEHESLPGKILNFSLAFTTTMKVKFNIYIIFSVHPNHSIHDVDQCDDVLMIPPYVNLDHSLYLSNLKHAHTEAELEK